MTTFKTGKFEMTLPENGGVSIVLCGASRSGKTTLLKYIYSQHFQKHITVMFTMNSQADIYKDLSDKIIISDEFHPELIGEAHQINKLTDNKYDFLFISDDYVSPQIKNNPEITKALTIYRNAGTNSIFSFQGRTLLSAVGRNNANYIAILKQNTSLEWINVIKEFLDGWLPMGMSMREKVDFCMKACENHQFFFIDNITGTCILTKLSKEQAGV